MNQALREAGKAFEKDEVPIGALAVKDGKVVARAHNIRETTQDPLGHAEVLLLKKVSRRLKSWRLKGVTVYVTLEPCLMCMGAMIQARVDRLVFGAMDPKAGGCGSLYNLAEDVRLNHRIDVTADVLGAESKKLLKHFFQILRNSK